MTGRVVGMWLVSVTAEGDYWNAHAAEVGTAREANAQSSTSAYDAARDALASAMPEPDEDEGDATVEDHAGRLLTDPSFAAAEITRARRR